MVDVIRKRQSVWQESSLRLLIVITVHTHRTCSDGTPQASDIERTSSKFVESIGKDAGGDMW
jgi:hypothetical protein